MRRMLMSFVYFVVLRGFANPKQNLINCAALLPSGDRHHENVRAILKLVFQNERYIPRC